MGDLEEAEAGLVGVVGDGPGLTTVVSLVIATDTSLVIVEAPADQSLAPDRDLAADAAAPAPATERAGPGTERAGRGTGGAGRKTGGAGRKIERAGPGTGGHLTASAGPGTGSRGVTAGTGRGDGAGAGALVLPETRNPPADPDLGIGRINHDPEKGGIVKIGPGHAAPLPVEPP